MSPSIRQSTVGLMLLAALGLLGVFILWVQNFSLRGGSFKATIMFPNAGNMTPGTNVTYRGVNIGQVESIVPEPEAVAVGIAISPGDRLIPVNSRIEIVQAGLVGETSIDITPLQTLISQENIAKPLDPNCDRALIICDGSRLEGEAKLDVNTLIRSLLKISNIISDPELLTAFRSLTKNATNALGEVSTLVGEANKNESVKKFDSTLNSLDRASGEVSSFVTQLSKKDTVNNLNSTLASVGGAAEEIRVFLASNQTNLANTLNSIAQTSDQIRVTAKSLTPIIERVQQGGLLDDLETTAANGAELTANLRDFSANLNSPQTRLLLEQTLNSARAAFNNIQKITADVDELTGNAEFRQDIERLMRGLSNLISSTQLLQQQVEYDRQLNRIAAEIAKLKLEGKLTPNQQQSVPALEQDINKSNPK